MNTRVQQYIYINDYKQLAKNDDKYYQLRH